MSDDGARVVVPPLATAPRLPLGPAVTAQGQTMGTSWSVQAYAEGRLSARQLHAGVQARLDEVVGLMSHWDGASDLRHFSRLGPGSWLELAPPFHQVMAEALRVAQLSDGAFDPAAAPLIDLWGFGPAGVRGAPPSPREIAEARARSGWTRLALDGARLRQPGGAGLDLSGIAKGFGVDHAAAFLEQAGVASYLLEVGGELRGAGVKGDGSPWWVALEPAAADDPSPPMRVALCGLSVATSGDSRRSFAHGGRSYSHTLDPRVGRPVENGVASVTVLHASCMTADALATAIGVLGWDAGMSLAQTEDAPCRMVRRADGGFEEQLSPALTAMLD